MKKKYSLEIDPRILELLGPNLYTNIYYVLAELIANAYDADAKNVYITESVSSIRVEDDGRGMSYASGDIDKYLNVAGVSRTNEEDSVTPHGRPRMGRKGVGKLAALSVSSEVDVITIAEGEKSGFVLSRIPKNGNQLEPIPDDQVVLKHGQDHGSAVIMRNPHYAIHKTMEAAKRNLLKMFPLVNADFRIHLERGHKRLVIDKFDQNVVKELNTLVTLGKPFAKLGKEVPDEYPDKREKLVSEWPPVQLTVKMADSTGTVETHTVEVLGWIGTYRSTKGRKAEATDFPDNFISLFANGKLGEFNILPTVGQNKLAEVYMVGQLHVDIFEKSELPDMALSNRQGYKTDDPRYLAVRDYVRGVLLPEVRRRRELYVDQANKKKTEAKRLERLRNEERLRKSVDRFRERASASTADAVASLTGAGSREQLREIVAKALNKYSPDLGLKSKVDSDKKRLLISQTRADKDLADVLCKMLQHNNVPAEDILYSVSDNQVCRVPNDQGVFDYLRDFFVKSYSTQGIHVLFVTSESMSESWGAVCEVGAAWTTRIDHEIFNIPEFRPKPPLDDSRPWQSTNRDSETKDLWMDTANADVLCDKIERVCSAIGYKPKTRAENLSYLETLVQVRSHN